MLGWSEVELPEGAKCTVRTRSRECRARLGCWHSWRLERESQEEVKGGWAESVAGDLSQDEGKEPRGRNGKRRRRCRSASSCNLKGRELIFLYFSFLFFANSKEIGLASRQTQKHELVHSQHVY